MKSVSPCSSNDNHLNKEEDLNSQQISIIKLLTKSNFSIYQVTKENDPSEYALKVFPRRGGKPSNSFKREERVKKMQHPNLISLIEFQPKGDHLFKNSSYILMEYAPHGDLVTLIDTGKFDDEQLIRTYFHQLISGIEYLHQNGVAHMDIKLENLLIGKDLNLKLIDFEYCIDYEYEDVIGKGTAHYRAPEVKNENCNKPEATDIYSAGIVLFALKAKSLPYLENMRPDGHDLEALLQHNTHEFWEAHIKFQSGNVKFSEEFRELFLSMVKANPEERATIKQIKESRWYKGRVYSVNELTNILSK